MSEAIQADTYEADLEYLRALSKHDYWPNSGVIDKIGQVTLSMLVGPACSGKSTIQAESQEYVGNARVRSFTTRLKRGGEDDFLYYFLPDNAETMATLRREAEAGNLVQLAPHDRKPVVYGTYARAYYEDHCTIDMLASNAEHVRALPWKRNLTYGIVVPPDDWERRITNRYPDPQDIDRVARLQEALSSLEWLMKDKQVIWLRNGDNDNPHENGRTINAIAHHPLRELPDFNGRPLAEAMHQRAELLLERAA